VLRVIFLAQRERPAGPVAVFLFCVFSHDFVWCPVGGKALAAVPRPTYLGFVFRSVIPERRLTSD